MMLSTTYAPILSAVAAPVVNGGAPAQVGQAVTVVFSVSNTFASLTLAATTNDRIVIRITTP